MSKACAICGMPPARKKSLENAVRRGDSVVSVANRYSLARNSVRHHMANHMSDAGASLAAAPPPLAPAIHDNTSPLEAAHAHRLAVYAALRKGEADALPVLDLSRLRTAYGRAIETEARLSRLTPDMILKSEAWGELLKQVTAALADHPEAVRALHAAFRR